MAILADSRENLSFNTQLTTEEIHRVTGMETHYAKSKADLTNFKSKAMFFPAKGSTYTTPSLLIIKDYEGNEAFIPFEPSIKYLSGIYNTLKCRLQTRG